MSNPKNSLKALTLTVGLSVTNGKFDESTTRRIVQAKIRDLPAEIRRHAAASLEDVLTKIDPTKHEAIKVTFYAPKVEAV